MVFNFDHIYLLHVHYIMVGGSLCANNSDCIYVLCNYDSHRHNPHESLKKQFYVTPIGMHLFIPIA